MTRALPSLAALTSKIGSRASMRPLLKAQIFGRPLSQCTRPAPLHRRPAHPTNHRTLNTSALQTQLTKRSIPITFDYLNPTPSHLLNISLTDIFSSPSTTNNTTTTTTTEHPTTRPSLPLPSLSTPTPLPPAHHLIYFPPAIPAASLLPDGTDPLQSPGPPFTRRMWAGGSMRLNLKKPLLLDGKRAACVERIADVTIKGKEGEEKIFVGIERRVGVVEEGESEESVRERFGTEEVGEGEVGGGEVEGEWSVCERRNLVFMREAPAAPPQKSEGGSATQAPAKPKIMTPPENADFTHTFLPTPRLLFRYSALTWNAHAIHLDPQYTRDIEGHRGLLVHGPLSFTLLVTNLRRFLASQSTSGEGQEEIEFVEYRNLAPVYCSEEMTVAGRRKEGESGKWEVWVQGPDGGVKVRGVVRTRRVDGGGSGMGKGYGDIEMLMA